jgi:hypothetical protein
MITQNLLALRLAHFYRKVKVMSVGQRAFNIYLYEKII